MNSAVLAMLKFIDRSVGYALIAVIRVFSGKKKIRIDKKKKYRILFIKRWAVGDCVNAVPLIKAVREKFPDSEIELLGKKEVRDVFQHLKFIDRLIIFEDDILRLASSPRSYDIVFDLDPYMNESALLSWYLGKFRVGISGQFRSGLYSNDDVPFVKTRHMAEIYMDMGKSLGINKRINSLEKIPGSKEDKKFVDEYFKSLKIRKKIVMIAPGVGRTGKQRVWPHENYAKLADLLVKNKNVEIVFVGTAIDKNDIDSVKKLMKCRYHDLCSAFKLSQFFHAAEKADVFVSNDSGTMHVAATQGVKTLGLFGPNLPSRWRPFGPDNDFCYHELECSPCIVNEKGRVGKCTNREYQKCMKLITVEEAYLKITKLLGEK